VLKVLNEMHIPVDYIVGTSMGAIVAGAYSSGMSVEEMERRVRAVRWDRVLSDQPSRAERSVRSKQLDQRNIYGAELGIRDGELLFPAGAIIGQHLEAFLASLIGGAVDLKSFDELPIPYRAVATDVVDGSMVILDHGNLAGAMRASMSVPGVFAPQHIGDRRLVDGGLVRNLPIDVARELGAEVIIAVNLGTPLLKPEELDTALGITAQMINILTEQNVQASLKQMRADDVLILPELGNFGAGDFTHAADTIEVGEHAARQVAAQLARYALPAEEYAALRAAQMTRSLGERPQVDEVRVETVRLRYVNPESVKAQIKTRTGDQHDQETLSRDMEKLYVTDDFQQVYYRFEEQNGKRVLVVEPVEKSWGPNYLRFGLNLGTDFKGESSFTIGVDHRATWLNSRGLEWRNDVYLGQHTGWLSELYQPIDLARVWFVAPTIYLNQQSYDLFVDERSVARYLVRNAQAGLQVGRRLGTVGEARLGYVYGSVHAYPSTGVSQFTDMSVKQGGLTATLTLDQFDNWAFPSSGYNVSAQYWAYRDGLGADVNYDKAIIDANYAFGFGRHSLVVGGKYGTRFGTALPFYDAFSLGGLLNLSGFQDNQLLGTGVKFGRIIYHYRLGGGGQFVNGYYAGASLEAGNVTDRINGPVSRGLIWGSALFLAADTVLGPLYLAAGFAEGGSYAVYLYLGRR
jgi:NTE family protein